MANRFYSPNQQFCDTTGAPYAAGTLAFYASGTSTPLNTYSDSALTIPNTNPVVLDSAGRAGNIFLQNLAYKVVLSDSNSNPIWTDDPVYSSDYSTRAKFASGSGSPNGTTAGTAGSATIGADTYWDTTNNILYVCTQTGTSSTAVWTAINAGAATAIVPLPQGYLTPVSGTPIILSDATSVTQIYYTPYVGNQIPVYNGSSFVPSTFAELSLALVSQHQASNIYDVFVFNNNGVLTLVTGPAWSTATAGAGARGTGAGTTQLSRLNGLWVNTVSMTGRNGSTTYAVPANQGTYTGSIFIDSVAGQVTCHRSYGQSRKWGIWNAFNRQPTFLKAGDGTASWSYTTNAYRPANNNAANSLTIFSGLAEDIYDLQLDSYFGGAANTLQTVQGAVGIGVNSTTAISGTAGQFSGTNSTGSGQIVFNFKAIADHKLPPLLGINTITMLENGLGANACSFNGTEASIKLTANWKA
jgi:hypothetical protein